MPHCDFAPPFFSLVCPATASSSGLFPVQKRAGLAVPEGGGFSFRTYEDFLLVGGGGHRTGKGPGPEEGYRAIRTFADAAYPGCVECCAWATQDCMSLDGMPYIGVHRR